MPVLQLMPDTYSKPLQPVYLCHCGEKWYSERAADECEHVEANKRRDLENSRNLLHFSRLARREKKAGWFDREIATISIGGFLLLSLAIYLCLGVFMASFYAVLDELGVFHFLFG